MIEMKSISTIETLYDDPSTRLKYKCMEKLEIMADDARNPDMEFWISLDDFLEWGKTYRITIEECQPTETTANTQTEHIQMNELTVNDLIQDLYTKTWSMLTRQRRLEIVAISLGTSQESVVVQIIADQIWESLPKRIRSILLEEPLGKVIISRFKTIINLLTGPNWNATPGM